MLLRSSSASRFDFTTRVRFSLSLSFYHSLWRCVCEVVYTVFVLRALVERERETPEEELSRLTSRSRRTIYPSIFISSSFFQREERGGRYSGLNIIGGLILYFVKVEYKEKRTPGQIKVAPTIIITAHNRGKWKWKLLSRKNKENDGLTLISFVTKVLLPCVCVDDKRRKGWRDRERRGKWSLSLLSCVEKKKRFFDSIWLDLFFLSFSSKPFWKWIESFLFFFIFGVECCITRDPTQPEIFFPTTSGSGSWDGERDIEKKERES